MEILDDLKCEVRVKWINIIYELAKKRDIEEPFAFARGIEHEAFRRRQTLHQISDGVSVYRYGDMDVLDIDFLEAHMSASIQSYTKMLRRICWALQHSNVRFGTPQEWIEASNETLLEGTLHAAWETGFYASQDLAREVLAGKGTATRGIFACTRCKSFDVDTDQKQTRSADEPMTIFCTCNVCGKRFVR